jgi:ADP-ribose pyrophosphatase YjhB (NUDIX family)
MLNPMTRNSHCSYCGEAFPADLAWPRTCGRCGSISYVNPLPVSVILVPVDEGLLLVRRTIPPREGSLALPGGFIGVGESWQQAGAREVLEETGLQIDPDEIRLYDVLSAPDGTVLIFGLAHPRARADLPPFAPNEECSEAVVAMQPVELAFPLHTRVAQRFWQDRSSQ